MHESQTYLVRSQDQRLEPTLCALERVNEVELAGLLQLGDLVPMKS